MGAETVPYGRVTQRASPVPEVHILWITAGLGCDGDSVSITAATQPSIEDVVLGAIPGLPKVHLHNPVLAYEIGDEFLKFLHDAAEGRLDPFVLVVEGSIPEREDQARGLLGRDGDRRDDRAADPDHRVDRPAGAARRSASSPSAPAPPTAASTRWRATRPAAWAWPTTSAGTGAPRRACRSSTCPAVPVQPDNFMETVLYLLYQAAGLAPMIPLDDQLRPTWLFGKTVHEGCDRAGYYEQGDFATEYGSPKCIVKLGCWGPVVNCNVPKRGWMAGIGGCPNVGGICIGCTMPGFPDKFMPFMDEPPGASSQRRRARIYGRTIIALRTITNTTVNKEPKWRHPRARADHRLPATDFLTAR